MEGVGSDCLGLVRGVWRAVIGEEPETAPPYSPDWAEAFGEETLAAAAARHLVCVEIGAIAPGDVLLFRWRAHLPAKHAAILVESDRMVHAHDGAAVAEVYFASWWRRRLAGAYQFPGVEHNVDAGSRVAARPGLWPAAGATGRNFPKTVIFLH